MELYNWTSYWNAPHGEEGSETHLFSFNSDSNRNGYAIFGENSRGKSSFSDAIEWALFGEAWTKPESADGRVQTRKLRPLVGHPKDQLDPLLNFQSFLSGNCVFYVRITFEKDGEVIQITRVASPADDSKPVANDDDMGVSLVVRNTTTDSEVFAEEAQEYIFNHILPKNLTRFFFIDGESITEYRALISSKAENVAIRKNIEDILNFPVLKKGITDLENVKSHFLEELTQLNRSKKRLRRLGERIDDKNAEIGEKRKLLEAAKKSAKDTKNTLDLLDVKMSGLSSAESLMGQKSVLERLLQSKRSDLERSYSDRKTENQDLWLVMLQGAIEDSLEELNPMIDSYENDRQATSELRSSISYLRGLSTKESESCPTCNQLPQPRDDDKIREDEAEIERKSSELEVLLEKVESNTEILRTRDKLSRFRTHTREKFLSSNISEINRLIGEIEEQESELSGINRSLDSIDQDEVSDLRSEIKKLTSELAGYSSSERRHQNDMDELNSEKSKLMREMIGDHGTEESIALSSKVESLEYLERMWESVLDNYSQEIRKDVEDLASKTFRKLTNNPRGFHSISLNERFGLTVLDSDGFPVQNPSPGLMQVTAISLIDALGERSNISFPIFFDTPGQSIDQGHRNRIIDHYWSEREMQFVIIPSSGEFRPDEVEDQYGHLIARTWELDFDNETNRTKVRIRV